jgi:hypothetical protein
VIAETLRTVVAESVDLDEQAEGWAQSLNGYYRYTLLIDCTHTLH